MPLPLLILLMVLLVMLVELRRSQANERALRRAGAVEPRHEVYDHMRWAYPGAFIAMALEGTWRGVEPGGLMAAGAAVFLAAKLLKGWAIVSLGRRWTYRLLVLPGVPLVTHGPYRFMRHPNYVGVIGELVGMAVMMGALVTGPLGIIGFGTLLRRRIQVEERALASDRRGNLAL
jgi:methyltransferase